MEKCPFCHLGVCGTVYGILFYPECMDICLADFAGAFKKVLAQNGTKVRGFAVFEDRNVPQKWIFLHLASPSGGFNGTLTVRGVKPEVLTYSTCSAAYQAVFELHRRIRLYGHLPYAKAGSDAVRRLVGNSWHSL